MSEETLKLILDKNPGLLSILLTGVLLPLGILWLTNRHSRKQRESEKSIEIKYSSKVNLRLQEKVVFACLSKILFDVQQLHNSLSGTCVSGDCIVQAINKFEESIVKYHGDISNNMLYLSSEVVNLIYKFYGQTSKLKMELIELNDRKAFDMAPILVFFSSRELADTVIEVQEIFTKERSDLKVHFDKAEQGMMMNLCGSAPSEAMRVKYEQVKQTLMVNK